MEKTLIVANWKENLTATQMESWVAEFSIFNFQFSNETRVVICPSFVLISVLKSQVSSIQHQVYLGAQDVSKFEEGQYTGEVSAKMLKDFVSYVIIGHSERRKCFGETDGDVAKKSILALKHGLIPIVCVSNLEQVSKCQGVKVSKTIFAYEPLFAVGTGTPDTPENAQEFAEKIKSAVGQDVRVLYGGSVNAENVKSFVSQPDIDGVLVGQASLEAEEFGRIIKSLNH